MGQVHTDQLENTWTLLKCGLARLELFHFLRISTWECGAGRSSAPAIHGLHGLQSRLRRSSFLHLGVRLAAPTFILPTLASLGAPHISLTCD